MDRPEIHFLDYLIAIVLGKDNGGSFGIQIFHSLEQVSTSDQSLQSALLFNWEKRYMNIFLKGMYVKVKVKVKATN